ncbi:aromatic acid exporter family protein [Fictibacillus sp. Mic-4]|uniref:aromatic acid exporter family protein n=1 Tax=Fictibacillus TaxID=1329200 RepID=UPI0003FB7DEF|nr:aromatic acid exporter family protein [Fictibacillus gelatini]
MPKFKIGYRTIKTAIGAGAAIAIAQYWGLNFYSSAGILAILCIKVTKKRSLINAWERFAACMIGMVFAFVFFSLLGYNPFSISLLILLFIPTVVFLKVKEGFVTSSVIILHLYTLEKLSWTIFLNELALIVIGIGIALIVNVYMPNMEKDLKRCQRELEDQFKIIFMEFKNYLHNGQSTWDGKEILIADRLIEEGKNLAFRDIENHFLRDENVYYHYFKMREKQFEIIERMLPIVSSIDKSYVQGKKLGDFFGNLGEAVHPGNTAVLFLEELNEMRSDFRQMPLPVEREEFETRAKLFYLLNEIERYLIIKREFKPGNN